MPVLGGPRGVRAELRATKAALLYADEVRLSSFLLEALGQHVVSRDEYVRRGGLEFGDYIRTALNNDREFSAVTVLVAGSEDPAAHLLEVLIGPEGPSALEESDVWAVSQRLAVAQLAPLCELGPAAQAGILEFLDPAVLDYFAFTEARNLVLRGDTPGIPVLDEWLATNSYVLRATQRLAEGHIAAELLCSVSAFPEARVEDILDIRARVGPARVRFRQAVSAAAAELSDVSPADYMRALEEMSQRIVQPARLEIDETLQDLGAVPTLLRLASDRVTLGTAVAGLALAASSPVLGATGGAILAAPAAAAAAKEALERRSTRRRARQNPFWLLHEIDRNLPPHESSTPDPFQGVTWIP